MLLPCVAICDEMWKNMCKIITPELPDTCFRALETLGDRVFRRQSVLHAFLRVKSNHLDALTDSMLLLVHFALCLMLMRMLMLVLMLMLIPGGHPGLILHVKTRVK